jgi:hypothetical protein
MYLSFDSVVYCVHWSFASNNCITPIPGMKDLFFIQGHTVDTLLEAYLKEQFTPYPTLDGWELRSMSILFHQYDDFPLLIKAHSNYNIRRTLHRLFRAALIESKGMKRLKFSFGMNYKDFIFLERFATSVHFSLINGKSSIILSNDGIIRSPSIAHVIGFSITRVDSLWDLIGNDFHYFPLCDYHHTIGSFDNHKFACIPHLNADILFQYDMNSCCLSVTSDVCIYSKERTFDGINLNNVLLYDFKEKYESKYVRNRVNNKCYYVIKLLYNNGDCFIQQEYNINHGGNICYLLEYNINDDFF